MTGARINKLNYLVPSNRKTSKKKCRVCGAMLGLNNKTLLCSRHLSMRYREKSKIHGRALLQLKKNHRKEFDKIYKKLWGQHDGVA